MRRVFGSYFLVLLLLVFSPTASAQSDGGSISGHVLDQNGAAVADATVRLRRKGTAFDRAVSTDASGSFRFDGLFQSEYDVSVAAPGFSNSTRELALAAGQSLELDLSLRPGPVAATVVVTSTRLAGTPEVVERTPGSVEIIDQKTLEDSRVLTFTEALRKVTGVNARDEEGLGLRPNIGIRGLNPTRSTKVLLLEDGIPLTYAPYGDNASYYHPPVDRFESIEVLKGSGQILFGPTTVGGVINYVTPAPPAEPSGYLSLTGGNRDYFNGHINYGGTWRSTGLLFDYTRKQGELARDDQRTGLNDFNFKSVTTIGQRQALTLKANYYGERSDITYSGLREAEYRADPRQSIFRNDHFEGNRYGASATHALVVNSNLTLTTNAYASYFQRDWWRQSSNSNERPNRLRTLAGGDPDCRGMIDLNTTCGNQGRLRRYFVRGVEPRARATFRLFGFGNEADFGGRIHFETQERRQENGDLPTSRSGLTVENNRRTNAAYSAFVQNRFLFGRLTVTPGLRVERINFERTNRLAGGGAGVTGRTSLTQWVPGLGVSYSPAQSTTIFAGVHRGFAPPRTEDIINNATGGSVDLDPELSWNYEVGVRSIPRSGLQLEATFFRMDYENQIIPASLAGGVGSALTNGGQTLHQGIELTGRVDSGVILKSEHNFYLRTAYTFLPVAEFTGTRFSNVGGFANVSITGNRLPYAPEHLLNANLGYSNPSGVDAFLEAVYVGRQFGDDLNTVTPTPDGQRGLIPSFTIWNATGNYRVESMRTTFFVTVKNVFDRTYIADRSRGILPSSPRLLQAGFKWRF
ncbi:MAG TPA: TonB-dependent receptor [Pyrinomonadaceae bacterium]|nr:TonB-dependent receptor [Pyrinomonadaceae bacterium]